MSEEAFVGNCCATLAGLKTGSLFACVGESLKDVKEDVREINLRLSRKGLRVIPISTQRGRTLVYAYRPGKLRRDLACPQARTLLEARGYPAGSAEACVAKLAGRIAQSDEFPHEVGLFLGYPPEDVEGFISHAPCKCTGCWKVYGDEAAARKRFAAFRHCREIYLKMWRAGQPIEKLTVRERKGA